MEGGSGIIQVIGNVGFDHVELSDQQEHSVHHYSASGSNGIKCFYVNGFLFEVDFMLHNVINDLSSNMI